MRCSNLSKAIRNRRTLCMCCQIKVACMEDVYKRQFLRQSKFEKHRKQAEEEILQHIGSSRKKLFLKLLHWAQETAPMRENAIYCMGMGHPLIRQMFHEISARLIRGGATSHIDLSLIHISRSSRHTFRTFYVSFFLHTNHLFLSSSLHY